MSKVQRLTHQADYIPKKIVTLFILESLVGNNHGRKAFRNIKGGVGIPMMLKRQTNLSKPDAFDDRQIELPGEATRREQTAGLSAMAALLLLLSPVYPVALVLTSGKDIGSVREVSVLSMSGWGREYDLSGLALTPLWQVEPSWGWWDEGVLWRYRRSLGFSKV